MAVPQRGHASRVALRSAIVGVAGDRSVAIEMATGVRAIPVTGEWPLARQPEPPALILDELTCYHFRVLDPVFRSDVVEAMSGPVALAVVGADRYGEVEPDVRSPRRSCAANPRHDGPRSPPVAP